MAISIIKDNSFVVNLCESENDVPLNIRENKENNTDNAMEVENKGQGLGNGAGDQISQTANEQSEEDDFIYQPRPMTGKNISTRKEISQKKSLEDSSRDTPIPKKKRDNFFLTQEQEFNQCKRQIRTPTKQQENNLNKTQETSTMNTSDNMPKNRNPELEYKQSKRQIKTPVKPKENNLNQTQESGIVSEYTEEFEGKNNGTRLNMPSTSSSSDREKKLCSIAENQNLSRGTLRQAAVQIGQQQLMFFEKWSQVLDKCESFELKRLSSMDDLIKEANQQLEKYKLQKETLKAKLNTLSEALFKHT